VAAGQSVVVLLRKRKPRSHSSSPGAAWRSIGVVTVVGIRVVVLVIDVVQHDANQLAPALATACLTRCSMARGNRRCCNDHDGDIALAREH